MSYLAAAGAANAHCAAATLCAAGRVHMVGIGGAGMRSLADVLDEAGWQVSGSDLSAAALDDAPYAVRCGHDAQAIDAELELVVHSDAVPPDNPELRRARQLGIAVLTYPQMLARLLQNGGGVAIAGTHGKSTTTAMTGEILAAAGLDPTLVVGAAPIGGLSGGRFGQGPWTVVEACEFRDNFHYLRPELTAILNVELDHVDCFPTSADLEDAFARYAQAQSRPADESSPGTIARPRGE